MKILKLFALLLLANFLLSTVPAAVFGAEQVTSGDSLSAEDMAIQKAIAHIKDKADCSDYEAGMIVGIMANHCNQEQGFDFYIKYISGDDDAEKSYNNAPYYKQYVDHWDGFAEDWKYASLEQKAEALNVESDSVESMVKIFENITPDESIYISSYMMPYLDKISNLSDEIQNINPKEYKKIESKARDINNTMNDLCHSVVNAHYEYSMKPSKPESILGDYNTEISQILKNNNSEEKIEQLKLLKNKYIDMNKTLYEQAIKIKDAQIKVDKLSKNFIVEAGPGLIVIGGIFIFMAVGFANPAYLVIGILIIGAGVALIIGGIVLIPLVDSMKSNTNMLFNIAAEFFKLSDYAISAIDEAINELSHN